MTAYDRAAEGLRARIRREEAALQGYLTIDDAAAELGVARFTVNRMIGDGRLHAVRYEHRWVTRPEWIDAVARTRKSAAAWRLENGWLSVAEAAKMLGITRQALNVRIQRGSAVRGAGRRRHPDSGRVADPGRGCAAPPGGVTRTGTAATNARRTDTPHQRRLIGRPIDPSGVQQVVDGCHGTGLSRE